MLFFIGENYKWFKGRQQKWVISEKDKWKRDSEIAVNELREYGHFEYIELFLDEKQVHNRPIYILINCWDIKLTQPEYEPKWELGAYLCENLLTAFECMATSIFFPLWQKFQLLLSFEQYEFVFVHFKHMGILVNIDTFPTYT